MFGSVYSAIFLLCFANALYAATLNQGSRGLNHYREGLNRLVSFDLNGDGVVKGMELYNILRHLDGPLGYTQSEARTILQLADLNSDNQLDVFELVELAKLTWAESLQH